MSTTLIVGCGYLGLRVARLLLDRGQTVIGTTRSATRAIELQHAGVTPLLADLLDPALAPLPACERLLVSVAPSRSGGPSPQAVYVEGLRALLERLPNPAPRIVLVSSTGVYGQSGGEWVNEDSPAVPRTESGAANLQAESILRKYAQRTGAAHAVIRLAGLYGPGRILRADALRRGEPIAGDPDHTLNLIHADDAARFTTALLLSDDAPRTLYVASDDRPVSRREFYEATARLLNAPSPRFVASDPVGRDLTNKRIDSRRIKRDLGLACLHPTYASGLAASLSIAAR